MFTLQTAVAALPCAAHTPERRAVVRNRTVGLVEEQQLAVSAITDAARTRGVRVIGSWTRLDAAFDAWTERPPRLAVIDANLLGLDPLASIETLTNVLGVSVLLRARLPRIDYVHLMLHAGASGVVCSLADASVVLDAIDEIVAGAQPVPAELKAGLHQRLLGRHPVPYLTLSARQREIIALIAAGATARQVAERLVVSVATVRTHLAQAYEKLGVHGHAEALMTLAGLGLVTSHHLQDARLVADERLANNSLPRHRRRLFAV